MRCNAYLKLGSKIDPYTYIDQETKEEVTVSMRKWITTKGLDHMESDHPEHPLGVKRRARRDKQAHNRVAALTQKMHGPGGHCGAVKETAYVQEAQAAQARSYIYCRGRMSKSHLDDPYHRESLQAAGALQADLLREVLAESGVLLTDKQMETVENKMKKRGAVPIVKGHGVKNWVQAEFDLFQFFLRIVIGKCQVECLGNPVGQYSFAESIFTIPSTT